MNNTRLTARPHAFAGAVLAPRHAKELTPTVCLAIAAALADQNPKSTQSVPYTCVACFLFFLSFIVLLLLLHVAPLLSLLRICYVFFFTDKHWSHVSCSFVMFYSVLLLTICRYNNIDYGFLKRGVYLDGQNPVLHSTGRYVRDSEIQ
jgi:hypothetical protein